jgi:hypothetical protein
MGVSTTRSVRYTVTFTDEHAAKNMEGMLESNFIGLGQTYRVNERVLILRPFPGVADARETLEELRSVGALTFVEEFL